MCVLSYVSINYVLLYNNCNFGQKSLVKYQRIEIFTYIRSRPVHSSDIREVLIRI